MDAELRWLVVRRLAAIGAVDEEVIAAELERDPTSNGKQQATAARTSLPTEEAKARAWDAVIATDLPSVGILNATTEHFWHREQLDLCAPYVGPILDALPEIWRTQPSEAAWGITLSMFPSMLVAQSTIDRVDQALAGDFDGALRRLLVEGRDDLARAMRTHAADR